jgi:hypothetical protein
LHGASLGFRFRQTSGERVFIGGFQVQRQLLNDFDFAFARQARWSMVFPVGQLARKRGD